MLTERLQKNQLQVILDRKVLLHQQMMTQDSKGRVTGNIDVLYKNATSTIKASLHLTNNNVSKVVKTKTKNN